MPIFFLQDGIGERQLIYLNESVPRSGDQEIQRILERAWNYSPQVSIFKASVGIAKENGSIHMGFLGRNVMDRMKSQHGLILEGTALEVSVAAGSGEYYKPEFSDYFNTKQLPTLHPGGRSYIIPEIEFGYGKGILVTDFQ